MHRWIRWFSVAVAAVSVAAVSLVQEPVAAAAPPLPCPSAAAASTTDWIQFRSAYPYHIQGVALARPAEGGCRTLILAEPPPHLTLADLQHTDPSLAAARVEQHGVGHDGWTRDVVTTLPPLSDVELRELVSRLHVRMFGTSYKAYALGIPSAPPARPRVDLNAQISAAELHRWLIERSEPFAPVEGGPSVPFEQLAASPEPGVYFASTPGLVAWAIPRLRPFEDSAVEARQFALDTDLVVGAVASATTLVVLGRERKVDVDVLPPMRVETLNILAAVKDDELAQSYERSKLFAGPLDGRRDWAPIYLSAELVDTEYGSLLNITDQILKSWSNNGETRYGGFSYPDPPRWAFSAPITKVLGVDSLTYNWNTRGLGAAIELGRYDMMAFRGTGALPVSYIAAKSTTQHEEAGYRFFAASHDPNLARVAEYAALYQILHRFKVPTRKPAPQTSTDAQQLVIASAARAMLDTLRSAPVADLLRAAKQTIAHHAKGAPLAKREMIELSGAIILREMQLKARSLDDDAIAAIATRAVASRDITKDAGVVFGPLLTQRIRAMSEIVPALLAELTDREALLKRYGAAATVAPGAWIHTPTVVLSSNSGALSDVTGGHNLDAHVARLRASNTVTPGALRTVIENGVKVTLYHPTDFPGVSKALSGTPLAVRPIAVALNPAGAPVATAARGLSRPGAAETIAGWRSTGHLPAGEDAALVRSLSQPDAPVVLVERSKDGFAMTFKHDSPTVMASTGPDAVHALAHVVRKQLTGKAPLELVFKDMSEEEAGAMMRGVRDAATKAGDTRPRLGLFSSKPLRRLARIFREPCDLERLTVEPTEELSLKSGGKAVSFKLRVPLQKGGRSLLVRFQLIADRITASIKARFDAVVAKVTSGWKASGSGATIADLSRAMHEELDDLAVQAGGHVVLTLDEVEDAYLVLLEGSHEADEPSRHPG
jgi:hypothetical protein